MDLTDHFARISSFNHVDDQLLGFLMVAWAMNWLATWLFAVCTYSFMRPEVLRSSPSLAFELTIAAAFAVNGDAEGAENMALWLQGGS